MIRSGCCVSCLFILRMSDVVEAMFCVRCALFIRDVKRQIQHSSFFIEALLSD